MRLSKYVRGRGSCLAVVCGLLGAAAPCVQAQSVYDGVLTTAQQAEVLAWSALYWQRVDQGGGSPGAGFTFTAPELNSPLFNPLRGARATLEKVGSIAAADCDQMAQLDSTVFAPEAAAVREAFRKVMLEGKIETDIYSNPSGAIEHANLILAAPANAGLTVYFDGTKLVSFDLPLEKISTDAYQVTLAMNLSQQSQNIIAALIASGAQWAADAGTVSEATKAITGQSSRADTFAATVQSLLQALEVDRSSTDIVYAQFGVYGALPLVVVQLGDGMVLMDPLSGNLSGPFATTSAIDASGLLSAYSAQTGNVGSIKYFTATGCPIVVAKSWQPTWPGTGTPPTLTPSVPAAPPAPAVPAGGPGTYTCTNGPLGSCKCIRTPTMTPTTPPTTAPVREICTYSPAGCGPGGSCGGPPANPTYPSGDPPGGGQGCNPPSCRIEWYY